MRIEKISFTSNLLNEFKQNQTKYMLGANQTTPAATSASKDVQQPTQNIAALNEKTDTQTIQSQNAAKTNEPEQKRNSVKKKTLLGTGLAAILLIAGLAVHKNHTKKINPTIAEDLAHGHTDIPTNNPSVKKPETIEIPIEKPPTGNQTAQNDTRPLPEIRQEQKQLLQKLKTLIVNSEKRQAYFDNLPNPDTQKTPIQKGQDVISEFMHTLFPPRVPELPAPKLTPNKDIVFHKPRFPELSVNPKPTIEKPVKTPESPSPAKPAAEPVIGQAPAKIHAGDILPKVKQEFLTVTVLSADYYTLGLDLEHGLTRSAEGSGNHYIKKFADGTVVDILKREDGSLASIMKKNTNDKEIYSAFFGKNNRLLNAKKDDLVYSYNNNGKIFLITRDIDNGKYQYIYDKDGKLKFIVNNSDPQAQKYFDWDNENNCFSSIKYYRTNGFKKELVKQEFLDKDGNVICTKLPQ